MRKLALKKLKSSDLSFFKSYFQRHPQTKQKGFNLDKKLVEGVFFPAISTLLEPLPKKATHVDLSFFGPGLAGPHSLARKVKIDAKNLRLNGELIHDPDDEPNRYDALAAGDFAIIEFGGTALPDAVKVVLVACGNTSDKTLHKALNQILPNEDDSMVALSDEKLQAVIEEASPVDTHPIREWLDPVILEEIGFGDSNAVQAVNKHRPGRGISPQDFNETKNIAARTGQLGEELLKAFFDTHETNGIKGYDWVSQINAISPFDFRVIGNSGELRHIDAKSTTGKFSTPLYISMAEIKYATSCCTPYDIYRVFDVTETSAKIKIARNIANALMPIMECVTNLPKGVNADSFSFDPNYFSFDEEIFLIDIALHA